MRLPRDVWPTIMSYCSRTHRAWVGYDYERCIQLRIQPCKLALSVEWLQPLQNALEVRTQYGHELFIYDADKGTATYFAMYTMDEYEYAVTTRTALTTPTCGEWIVWAGGVERVAMMRNGRLVSHSSTVSKSYCFQLDQLPNRVFKHGQCMSVESYWSPTTKTSTRAPS